MSVENTIDTGTEGVMADPMPEDKFEAAERDAAADVAEDNAESEEVEAQEEDPQPEAEAPDETTDDPKDEDEPQEAAEGQEDAGDFDPSTLPEPLKKKFIAAMADVEAKKKGADKYFHAEAQKLAAVKREYDALIAEARATSAEGRIAGQAEVEQGPPQLPAWEEGMDPADYNRRYNEALDARIDWVTDQKVKAQLQSGQFAPADRVQQLEQQTAVASLESKLRSIPGFTDQHAAMMVNALETDDYWGPAYAALPEQTAMKLAKVVMQETQIQQTQQTQAKKAEAKTQKQLAASKQATPRITNASGAPEDVFAGKKFKDEDAMMAYAEKMALEE